MAHCLPKKKYLQLLHDASSPSGSYSSQSTPDLQHAITPPLSPVQDNLGREAREQSNGFPAAKECQVMLLDIENDDLKQYRTLNSSDKIYQSTTDVIGDNDGSTAGAKVDDDRGPNIASATVYGRHCVSDKRFAAVNVIFIRDVESRDVESLDKTVSAVAAGTEITSDVGMIVKESCDLQEVWNSEEDTAHRLLAEEVNEDGSDVGRVRCDCERDVCLNCDSDNSGLLTGDHVEVESNRSCLLPGLSSFTNKLPDVNFLFRSSCSSSKTLLFNKRIEERTNDHQHIANAQSVATSSNSTILVNPSELSTSSTCEEAFATSSSFSNFFFSADKGRKLNGNRGVKRKRVENNSTLVGPVSTEYMQNGHVSGNCHPGITAREYSLGRASAEFGYSTQRFNGDVVRDDVILYEGGVPAVRVKEEEQEGEREGEEEVEEGEDEQSWLPPLTTSGRNRGCGKLFEPKYDCQVCGDTAAGFHCGAYVCEACKKFYLRSLKTTCTPATSCAPAMFTCPKNNDCKIDKDTRSHCQYCRFNKCLRLGMYKPGREDDKRLKIDFQSIACKVCNSPSSGFHFGAITCEGCKGFFRRMLKEQLHRKFICTSDQSCSIDSANRTTCKSCRFNKCLRIGMTLEGTRLGRQSNSVKRATLIEYVNPTYRAPPLPHPHSSIPPPSRHHILASSPSQLPPRHHILAYSPAPLPPISELGNDARFQAPRGGSAADLPNVSNNLHLSVHNLREPPHSHSQTFPRFSADPVTVAADYGSQYCTVESDHGPRSNPYQAHPSGFDKYRWLMQQSQQQHESQQLSLHQHHLLEQQQQLSEERLSQQRQQDAPQQLLGEQHESQQKTPQKNLPSQLLSHQQQLEQEQLLQSGIFTSTSNSERNIRQTFCDIELCNTTTIHRGVLDSQFNKDGSHIVDLDHNDNYHEPALENENQPQRALDNSQQQHAMDSNNQQHYAWYNNNQRLCALDNKNQQQCALSNNNQQQRALDKNNQQQRALDKNNQQQCALDNNNQRKCALDNNHQECALDNSQQQRRAFDNNNQQLCALENKNQPQDTLDNNNQQQCALDNNNQHKCNIDNNKQQQCASALCDNKQQCTSANNTNDSKQRVFDDCRHQQHILDKNNDLVLDCNCGLNSLPYIPSGSVIASKEDKSRISEMTSSVVEAIIEDIKPILDIAGAVRISDDVLNGFDHDETVLDNERDQNRFRHRRRFGLGEGLADCEAVEGCAVLAGDGGLVECGGGGGLVGYGGNGSLVGCGDAMEHELFYEDSSYLFNYLTTSFRELDEIMNRPEELDELQHDTATLDTLWKLVEIPFMHQARVVLKFVKKIPGFRQLPVDDQISMAQDSLYPIILIYHSQFYDLASGQFNWFINTAEERDLILSVLPSFIGLTRHFQSTGYALKTLALSDTERAFLATMTAFTAADGSYLQSSNDVEKLQCKLLEAFVSYQTAIGSDFVNNRVGLLLARLPELQRANIEHRQMAVEVHRLTPELQPSTLWREVFLSRGGGGRGR